eukprot:jgi/Undpi1/6160/HiC_scaffold_20.g08644.m1
MMEYDTSTTGSMGSADSGVGVDAGLVRSKAGSAQNRRQLKDKARSDGRPREPRLSSSTNQSFAGVAQPASARRRGLLSRPRGSQMVRDSTPVSAAETTRDQTGSEEHSLDQFARVQLLHVLEAFSDGAARSGEWLGTSLLPKATPKYALNGGGPCHSGGSCGRGSDRCVGGCGGGVGREELRAIGGGNRRVRARPASWGTRPSVERRGHLGLWRDGGDDDCWGDGDGHLTLRRFPSREAVAGPGAREENDEGATSPIVDAHPNTKEGKKFASSSRADRFLQVFARLQPARRALDIEEPAPVPSGDSKRAEGSRAGLLREPCVSSPSSRSKPRALLREDSATATPAADLGDSMTGAAVGSHDVAGERAVGGVGASSSKRKAVATSSTSSDRERRTSGETDVGYRRVQYVPYAQETANTNHFASPSSKRNRSPEIARPCSPESALTPAADLVDSKADAAVGSHDVAGERAVGRVGASSSKRKAVATGSTSPDRERRTSGGTGVGYRRVQYVPYAQETANTNRFASPSSKRNRSPEIARPCSSEPALTPAADLGDSMTDAAVGSHDVAGERAIKGVGASSSKRKAVATGSTSPDRERRTSGGTGVGYRRVQYVPYAQETANTNRFASPSFKRNRSPEIARPCSPEPALEHESRREPPAQHEWAHRQSAERPPEPQRVDEGQHVGAEGCKLEARSKTPSLPVQTKSRVDGTPGLDPGTEYACDAPAVERQVLRIVDAASKENSRPNHLHAAWDREGVKHPAAVAPPANGASSTRQNMSTSAVQRAPTVPTVDSLEGTTARRTKQSPSRRGRQGNAEDVTDRVAGSSSSDLRDSDSTASTTIGPIADLSGNRRSQGAKAASYQAKSGGKHAAITRQVSSGLLTSSGGARRDSRNDGSGERRPLAFAPIACEGPAAPVDMLEESDSSKASHAECQGHEADVAQQGSLTVVDPEQGATLRSSWSIDNSEELGKLEFGFSVDYDAVWYLSPADDECAGVLRYRVVPHPDRAPKGGWISERGRFLDDPYIIAKVTPATRPRPSHLARDPLSSSSTRCSQQAERTARGIEVGGVHRSKSSQDPAHPEQSRIKDGNGGTRSSRRAAGNRHLPAASQHGHAVQPGTSNENSQRRYHHRPPRKESGDRRPAGIAAGSSRLVQPASTSGREDAPAKGSLGLLPGPSADVLHINDSGDKVKCPVCQRGMDHWKSGQRQQHVHLCLLKQPSSAKKSPAAVATVDIAHTAGRASGSTHRPSVGGYAMQENGTAFPTPPHDSPLSDQRLSATSGENGPGSSARGRRVPDPVGSPRPTRVSLQGVFSPKPAPGPNRTDGRSRAAGHDTVSAGVGASPAAGRSSYPVDRTGSGTKQGMRAGGDSAPKETAVGGATSKKAMSGAKGPSECPVCRLDFEGRQGQWERQAHIQQCLDSMESVFDSEELL